MKKEKQIKWLKWAVSFAVAVSLLYIAFRQTDFGEFLKSMSECRFQYIIASMLIGIAAFFLRALRWKDIMQTMNSQVGLSESFDGINIGNISNFALPRAGEFIRCGVISSTGKLSYDKVLGSVVLERSWDMLTLLALLAAFFILKWKDFGKFVTDNMLIPLEESIPFNLWWIVAIAAIVIAGSVWLIFMAAPRNRTAARVTVVIKGAIQGFTAALRMRRKWRFLLLTAAIWTIYWMMSYLTALALPQLWGLDATDAMFLMLVGSIAWAIPVPGAIGAFHLLVSLALVTLYGVSESEAIAFATLSHEAQALTMILCGIVSIFRRARSGGRQCGQ